MTRGVPVSSHVTVIGRVVKLPLALHALAQVGAADGSELWNQLAKAHASAVLDGSMFGSGSPSVHWERPALGCKLLRDLLPAFWCRQDTKEIQ